MAYRYLHYGFSRPVCNGNDWTIHAPQFSRTRALPSDRSASYLWDLLGGGLTPLQRYRSHILRPQSTTWFWVMLVGYCIRPLFSTVFSLGLYIWWWNIWYHLILYSFSSFFFFFFFLNFPKLKRDAFSTRYNDFLRHHISISCGLLWSLML